MGHGDGKFGALERVWAWQGRDCAAGINLMLGSQVQRGT